MKRFFLPLTVVILSLGACLPQAAPPLTPPQPLTIVDALGREVFLSSPPQRIVITGKAIFMLADAAYLFPGAAEKIVGLGNAGQGASNFVSALDPLYEQKEILNRDAGAEQIVALRPDLVIMKSFLADRVGAPIEALGIPVIYVDFETPEQYPRDLEIFGQIFGDETRTAEVVDFYRNKQDEISSALGDSPRPRVLTLYYNDKDGYAAFNVPPAAWMQTRMVEMAGGAPVWADVALSQGWAQVTLEQIAAWDVDRIFVISYFKPAKDVVADLKDDVNWQAIRAVETGNIYAFPADFYSWDQPDPRWILGLSWLAAQLHPDLFPTFDILAEAQTFYQNLYGVDETFFKREILPEIQS